MIIDHVKYFTFNRQSELWYEDAHIEKVCCIDIRRRCIIFFRTEHSFKVLENLTWGVNFNIDHMDCRPGLIVLIKVSLNFILKSHQLFYLIVIYFFETVIWNVRLSKLTLHIWLFSDTRDKCCIKQFFKINENLSIDEISQ